jgi:hypothetical protein
VTLTSPDGGEDWKAGSSHAITWSASDNVGVTAVDLAWSADGGTTWPGSIATSLANSGTFTWTVPDAPGGNLRVRATARDAAANAASDASNASFAISRWQVTASAGPGGSVSPAGVTALAEHATLTITVSTLAGFALAGVVVDGAGIGAVASHTFSDIAADHTLAASFADIAAPTAALTSPAGGETWDAGVSHDVTWTASDNAGVTSVDLEWSAHGGDGPWLPIVTGTANDGTHSWTPPAVTTDSAMVRVTARDAAALAGTATSGRFRLQDATLGTGGREPARLALARPSPNPSRLAASLAFALPAAGTVRLEVLDVSGRRVWSRAESLPAGPHAWVWDGRDAAGGETGPGLYVVRLVTPWGTRGTRLARVR